MAGKRCCIKLNFSCVIEIRNKHCGNDGVAQGKDLNKSVEIDQFNNKGNNNNCLNK